MLTTATDRAVAVVHRVKNARAADREVDPKSAREVVARALVVVAVEVVVAVVAAKVAADRETDTSEEAADLVLRHVKNKYGSNKLFTLMVH